MPYLCFMVTLNQILNIQYPILMAPMFLVSDERMVLEALNSGITAAFPAANYRKVSDLSETVKSIKKQSDKAFGVNLIANRSNVDFNEQLQACVQGGVSFVITSLGSPRKAIEVCKPLGIKVFCDVTDLEYAQKVVSLGADALIAVNKNAGGHPGKMSGEVLCAELLKRFDVPVIYAGGISSSQKLDHALELGVAGVSIGTLFLASEEAPISNEYKQAVLKYGAKDIVKSDKLSGSELHVINTDYVKQIGTKSNRLTRFLYRHKKLRRYLKALTMKRGMKILEKAAFSATYKNVWVAGFSIEDIKTVRPLKQIVQTLVSESKQLN